MLVMFLQKITCILIFDEPQLSGQPPFMKLPLAGSMKVQLFSAYYKICIPYAVTGVESVFHII